MEGSAILGTEGAALEIGWKNWNSECDDWMSDPSTALPKPSDSESHIKRPWKYTVVRNKRMQQIPRRIKVENLCCTSMKG
jgi:hypothetical protein